MRFVCLMEIRGGTTQFVLAAKLLACMRGMRGVQLRNPSQGNLVITVFSSFFNFAWAKT